MPIIKSAKKRVRLSNRAAVRNAKTKRSLKNALKAFEAAAEKGGKSAELNKLFSDAQSAIDTAAKKNVLHKNKAARKKAQLSKHMKDNGGKLAKKAAKPAAAKKPTAKKTPAKKTAAKK